MNLTYTREEVEQWIKELWSHTDEGPTVMAHHIAMNVPLDLPGDVEVWENNGKALLTRSLRELINNYGKKRLLRVFRNDLGKNKIISEDHFINEIIKLLF